MSDSKKEEQKALPPIEAPKKVKLTLLDLPNKGMIPIPVLIATGDGDIDFEEVRKYGEFVHIITSKGTMLYTKTDLFESVVDAPSVKTLSKPKERLRYDLAKIPHDMVARINYFFQAVYDKYRSEAMMLLYYDPKAREWMEYCPAQIVSGASLDYVNPTPDIIDPRFLRMGSWHSHGSMSAFHSGTDSDDEFMAGTGLHLTSGDFEDSTKPYKDPKTGEFYDIVPEPEISASIVAGETRFSIDANDVLDCEVLKVKEQIKSKFNYQSSWKTKDCIVDIDDVPGFPEEWMDKVSKKVYTQGKGNGVGKGNIYSGGSIYHYGYGSSSYVEDLYENDLRNDISTSNANTGSDASILYDETKRTTADGYISIEGITVPYEDVLSCTECEYAETIMNGIMHICNLTDEYISIEDGDDLRATLCSMYEDKVIDVDVSGVTDSDVGEPKETCSDCQSFWNCFKAPESLDKDEKQCHMFGDKSKYTDDLEKLEDAEQQKVCPEFVALKETQKN